MQTTESTLAGERTLLELIAKFNWLGLYAGPRLLAGFDVGRPYRGFAARVNVGGGAGCRDGFTVFFAFNSGSRHWTNRHRAGRRITGKTYSLFTRLTGLEIGFTRNANAVPYMNH